MAKRKAAAHRASAGADKTPSQPSPFDWHKFNEFVIELHGILGRTGQRALHDVQQCIEAFIRDWSVGDADRDRATGQYLETIDWSRKLYDAYWIGSRVDVTRARFVPLEQMPIHGLDLRAGIDLRESTGSPSAIALMAAFDQLVGDLPNVINATTKRQRMVARDELLALVEDYMTLSGVRVPIRRGRPKYDENETQRRFDAWKTGRYATYADCARTFGIPELEFKRSVDRARKRLKKPKATDR